MCLRVEVWLVITLVRLEIVNLAEEFLKAQVNCPGFLLWAQAEERDFGLPFWEFCTSAQSPEQPILTQLRAGWTRWPIRISSSLQDFVILWTAGIGLSHYLPVLSTQNISTALVENIGISLRTSYLLVSRSYLWFLNCCPPTSIFKV